MPNVGRMDLALASVLAGYAVGCAGVITHAERLADGRFNIVLRGMEKFRVMAEDADRQGAPVGAGALVQPLVVGREDAAADADQR